LSSKDVFNALKQSVLLHFGDVGWGEVGASLAGKESPCSFFFLLMFSYILGLKFLFFFRFWPVLVTVKYFSPMTNLCIVRVARGTAANTTWAALVLLDRVGASGGGQGRKVVPHVIHVSGTSPTPIFSLSPGSIMVFALQALSSTRRLRRLNGIGNLSRG
jgi:ribonuclease P/MRP protein subunit POP5